MFPERQGVPHRISGFRVQPASFFTCPLRSRTCSLPGRPFFPLFVFRLPVLPLFVIWMLVSLSTGGRYSRVLFSCRMRPSRRARFSGPALYCFCTDSPLYHPPCERGALFPLRAFFPLISPCFGRLSFPPHSALTAPSRFPPVL